MLFSFLFFFNGELGRIRKKRRGCEDHKAELFRAVVEKKEKAAIDCKCQRWERGLSRRARGRLHSSIVFEGTDKGLEVFLNSFWLGGLRSFIQDQLSRG